MGATLIVAGGNPQPPALNDSPVFHNLDNCVTCTRVITQWSKLGTCINCSSIRGVHLTHLKYPLQETADHSSLFLLLCTQPYICLSSCFQWLSSVIYMTNKQLWLTYHENWLLFTSTLYSALCLRDRRGGGVGRAAALPLFCAPAPTFCAKKKNN